LSLEDVPDQIYLAQVQTPIWNNQCQLLNIVFGNITNFIFYLLLFC
jgi:hypothetical protein